MEDLTILMYVVLAASLLALGFAYYFYRSMMSKEEGTELMKTIASHVRRLSLPSWRILTCRTVLFGLRS